MDNTQQELVIFQEAGQPVEVRLDAGRDTVWMTQRQMAGLFETSNDNISLHLKNIFADGELAEAATTEDSSVVRQEGKRQVSRVVKHYNLDAIISVGYRVSSKRAVSFRQWATRLLREHLTQGYTLNRQRFEANALELEAALQLVRKAAQSPELLSDTGRGLVDIVTRYAQTFLLLQRYDEGLLTDPPTIAGGALPTLDEARQALARLKAELMARGEATELFALERGDGLAGLLGNLDQTVFGEPAYLRDQESPVRRRQQAQRCVSVRGLSQPQWALAGRYQPASDQRYRPCRPRFARSGVRPGAERHADSPDHEHARRLIPPSKPTPPRVMLRA